MQTIIKTLPLLLLSTSVLAQSPVQLTPSTSAGNGNGPIPVYTIDNSVNLPQVQRPVTAAPETLAADLTARVFNLEETIRKLTGKIDNQNYKIQQLETQLKAVEAAAKQKSEAATSSSTNASAGTSEINRTIKESKQATLPTGSAQKDYDNAYKLIQAGQYTDAANAFGAFLKNYPKHALTANARYWLAETHYVRQDYGLAAEDFLKAYEYNPKGNKAADSLLKLSLALSGLNSKEEACLALDKLSEEYPDAGRSITDRAAKETTKLGCV